MYFDFVAHFILTFNQCAGFFFSSLVHSWGGLVGVSTRQRRHLQAHTQKYTTEEKECWVAAPSHLTGRIGDKHLRPTEMKSCEHQQGPRTGIYQGRRLCLKMKHCKENHQLSKKICENYLSCTLLKTLREIWKLPLSLKRPISLWSWRHLFICIYVLASYLSLSPWNCHWFPWRGFIWPVSCRQCGPSCISGPRGKLYHMFT